jgi:CDP-4-dehydro-6-deoxyglucose reductase
MGFTVVLQPSGHTFEAEPSETLLDAGLRAGLNLNHGCSSGSCGECQARLVSGELAASRHADFVFTERERAEGAFLLCSRRAVSDLVIEAPEARGPAEIPAQRVRAKVGRVEQLQADVVQLTVRAPRSQGLRFLAGQSVALTFDGLAPRTLPIASCPCDPVQLRFHVRRQVDDPFSELVFDHLRRGQEVELRGPVGEFTLDETSTRPLVFIAWESGFAPVSSLIDHAIQKDINRSIDLYWVSAIPRGHYLSNYCRAWRDVLDDFRYHSIDLAPTGDEELGGVIERVVRVHSLLADHDYYLVLPGPDCDFARRCLADADVLPEQVRCSVMSVP